VEEVEDAKLVCVVSEKKTKEEEDFDRSSNNEEEKDDDEKERKNKGKTSRGIAGLYWSSGKNW